MLEGKGDFGGSINVEEVENVEFLVARFVSSAMPCFVSEPTQGLDQYLGLPGISTWVVGNITS